MCLVLVQKAVNDLLVGLAGDCPHDGRLPGNEDGRDGVDPEDPNPFDIFPEDDLALRPPEEVSAKARRMEARPLRQLDEDLWIADVSAVVEDGLEEDEVISGEGLLTLKGCAFGGLGGGEAVVGKGLLTVPGPKAPSLLLPMGPLPVPPSIIVEGDGGVGLGPKEERPVGDGDLFAVVPFDLFQPNGGIVAPRSAVIVIDEEF